MTATADDNNIAKVLADEIEGEIRDPHTLDPFLQRVQLALTVKQWEAIVKALRSERYVSTRDSIIEECAKVIELRAHSQAEKWQNVSENYGKSRAWDAQMCAAEVRSLKNTPATISLPPQSKEKS
jgi:hypothetical protein